MQSFIAGMQPSSRYSLSCIHAVICHTFKKGVLISITMDFKRPEEEIVKMNDFAVALAVAFEERDDLSDQSKLVADALELWPEEFSTRLSMGMLTFSVDGPNETDARAKLLIKPSEHILVAMSKLNLPDDDGVARRKTYCVDRDPAVVEDRDALVNQIKKVLALADMMLVYALTINSPPDEADEPDQPES